MSGSHIELRDDGVYVDGVIIPGVVLTPIGVAVGEDDVSKVTVSIAFETLTDKRTGCWRGPADKRVEALRPGDKRKVHISTFGGSGGFPGGGGGVGGNPDDGTPIPA